MITAMERTAKLISMIDPFLLWLIAVVGAATVLPVQGVAADWFGALADFAIALLFFLHGAKLSRAAIVQGMGNWPLHLMVLASTYVLFPGIGLALVMLAGGWVNPLLLSGLLYLTLLPSTVQSSIAFTAMARGNVAAAVCSASLSNLLGIVLTPLLVSLLMQVDGKGAVSSWHSIWTIALQLLAPFLAGHFLRPLIGGFIDRNKAILQPVDRGSILLVVYSAFSAAVVGGIWTRVSGADLLVLLGFSSVVLALIMVANVAIARVAGLPREDAIVLLFCGSKKSLVSGVPMAGALFAPAHVGLIVLPLMIFHQLQLFLCAALAGRFRRQAEAHDALGAVVLSQMPCSEAELTAAAASIGLPVPDACMPGVMANMGLLRRHAATLAGRSEGGS
jgi:sodium/bile acid cotransporter 7